MLFGARAVINPTERLSFEFLQTSQWGGENINISRSTLNGILLGDSNIGENAEINKMAGFGISYTIPIKHNTFRVYGQAIGEDEAGNLPSCYSWMAGIEFLIPKILAPTNLAIEIIDTRVDTSTNGFCGPNTMYNNNAYKYINHNTVLGVPIDTESTSIELFGKSQINVHISINYSTKLLTINDIDSTNHRLSSSHSTGSITSLGISWKKNRLNFGGNIKYQNIVLDKAMITNGAMISLFTSIDI